MQVFTSIFESVAVLLGIGVLGFFVISRKVLPADALKSISVVAVDIALPCLVAGNILKRFSPRELSGWWHLPLWWAVMTVGFFVVAMLFSYFSSKQVRNEFRATLFYHNALFFPIAIIANVYGENSPRLLELFFFTVFYGTFYFNTYHLFFNKPGSKKFDIKKVFNPVFTATIIAVSIKIASLGGFVPGIVHTILGQVGHLTVPLLMLVIGGAVYIDFKETTSFNWLETGKFVLAKNVLFPSVMLLFLAVTGIQGPLAYLLMLQSAVPPITLIPVTVERVGGNRAVVNQFLTMSFIVSLVTIPLFMWLFSRLG